MSEIDIIVVGSGPNGLAAAVRLAQEELSVLVVEAKDTIGGGARTKELTLPGFKHDVCSAIHPMAMGSPFFQTLPLQHYGLKWIQPDLPLAHPFEDGSCRVLDQSLPITAAEMGIDEKTYTKLFTPFVEQWDKLAPTLLGPIGIPKHPLIALQFALQGFRSAKSIANKFQDPKTRGFFAGLAAHSILPLDQIGSGAIGLVLAIVGHVYGWPIPEGGSQSIVDALARYLLSMGGKIKTNWEVNSLDELPPAKAILFDLTPSQVEKITGEPLPTVQHGPGVFKIDWALSEPIPWKSEPCKRAGTVHLGGTFDEIAKCEKEIWEGKHPERPYVLVAQQSLFDPTRGGQTGWAYCHVPSGSKIDMTEIIENQIERYAPGFRDCILAKATMNATQMEAYNANYIGGDITGGVNNLKQVILRTPYRTSNPKLFLCSSSTPPGGGVHGMCGFHAAEEVLSSF